MLGIRLLGEMEVLRGEERLALPPSKKTRALLAYLALTGRPHRRERLCELFWEVPDDPRGALRWSLSKLRPLVDEPGGRPRIRADREFVGFDAAGAEIDIISVRRALAGGIDALETERLEALALAFRGELLEGQDLPELHDFQAWCAAEREDARRLHARILAALVERLEARPEEALPHARALVQENPFDEAARARLLRLLAAAGRRGEAEQQFDSGLRVLREAGVGTAGFVAAWRALKQDATPSHRGDTRAAPPAIAPVPRAAYREGAPPAPPLAPAAAPTLVGRRSEMERLLAAIGEVEAGGGGGARAAAVLLKGEPGVGKSALVRELARVVAAQGGAVLSGRAYEAERDRPFGPWIEALDGLPLALIGAAPPAGTASDLLGRREDRMLARERLFASVLEAVADRARRRPPLLLALEDVHWMDEASAALLHHTVCTLHQAPVMVALSARDGELPDNPPVLGVLRSLRHERLLDEIALGPLAAEEAEALVRAIAPEADARRTAAESGGNPLLAQELARALLEGLEEGGVPRTLRGLVRDRVERLPTAPAELLRWAAVLGPAGISVERLGELVPLQLPDFMAALETLERHALLQEAAAGDGGYAFRHELIRHAIYTGLSEPRRRLMHQRAAQALRRGADPGDGAIAAEIAHHASVAGDAALAAEACLAAGRRCLRLLAGAEAGMLAQRGLRHAEALREPDRTRLTLDLLHVQLAAVRPAAPAETARLIEELAQRALDHGCLEHARLGFHMLSHLRWEGGLWSEAERDTLRAELVSRSADERERVVAMAEAARCLALLERDLGQAEAFALEAGALARRLGIEPNAIADALGLLRLHQGAGDEAAALFERARVAARRDGDRASEFLALEHLVGLEIRRSGFGCAEALCAELAELAGRLRQDGSDAPYARALRALCRTAARRGDPEAEAELEDALASLAAADAKHRLAFALLAAAELDLRAGRHPRAKARAEEALRLSSLLDLPSQVAAARAALARVAEAAGDGAERRRQVEALRGMLGRDLSRHARDLAEALCAEEAPEGGGAG